LSLNAVIELVVDEDALVARIEKRAKETGGARADDNPETVRRRLQVYRAQTAPVADYYRSRGALTTVDGMASIELVSKAIDGILAKSTERV